MRLSKTWQKLSAMRMERKLLLVFLVVIILPLTFIGYISYRNYSNYIEKTTVAYSTNLIVNMLERVDDYIEDMSRISSIPAYQKSIRTNLIRSNEYYEQLEANRSRTGSESAVPHDFNEVLSIQRGIESNIKFINEIKRGANSVYIFDQFGTGYFSAETGGVRLNITDSYKEWAERAKGSGGEALLFSTQKYTSNLKSIKYSFTVVRKILDETLHPIGLIAVDANISVIEDQIVELDKLTHGKSLVIDDTEHVIYDSDKQLLTKDVSGDPMIKRANGPKGSFYHDIDGEPHLIIYTTSPNTHWKLIISIPQQELTKGSIKIRNVTWLATFIAISVALLISIFFSFGLTKPLRKMMRMMRTVQQGDLSVQFPFTSQGEIGQLGRQFNRMIVRIDELIRDIYIMETKKKEAEMYALQSQINPHFMYNTLETIRMTAELNDDNDAADMLSIFGKLLRYSIGGMHEEVTLRQELQHVSNYVEMLNYRYPNRFLLKVEIPEDLMPYMIIKLVLQPIVENAIYHGLDDSKEKMRIHIQAERDGGRLLIRIADDGLGMEPEVLERLNHSLMGMEQSRPNQKGIGMKNVNERLKLHYGKNYGVLAGHAEGGGTVIVLRLPLETKQYSKDNE